jgi:rRNA-processing protein FCF1
MIRHLTICMKKIILDTNFLLIPFTEKVDIFDEIDRIVEESYELFIIDTSLQELKKIHEEQKGKSKEAAKLALELVKKHPIEFLSGISDHVDDDIVALCKKDDYYVATQDKELKKKVKDLKRSIIILRQKNHLELF